MPFIREQQELIALAGLQSTASNQPGGVAEVYVFIDQTVYKHQSSLDIFRMRHHTALCITLRVGLRRVHIAFCVIGIDPS